MIREMREVSPLDDGFLPSYEEGEEALASLSTWNIVTPSLGLPH